MLHHPPAVSLWPHKHHSPRRLWAPTTLSLVFKGNLETDATLMRAGLITQHNTLHQQPVAV
jgi:hypothetical protein